MIDGPCRHCKVRITLVSHFSIYEAFDISWYQASQLVVRQSEAYDLCLEYDSTSLEVVGVLLIRKLHPWRKRANPLSHPGSPFHKSKPIHNSTGCGSVSASPSSINGTFLTGEAKHSKSGARLAGARTSHQFIDPDKLLMHLRPRCGVRSQHLSAY